MKEIYLVDYSIDLILKNENVAMFEIYDIDNNWNLFNAYFYFNENYLYVENMEDNNEEVLIILWDKDILKTLQEILDNE